MTFPVLIETMDGQFSASVAGSAELRCTGPSKDEAMALLQQQLVEKVKTGELVNMEMPTAGITGLAGRFADDPTLRNICEEIYRQRDADRTL